MTDPLDRRTFLAVGAAALAGAASGRAAQPAGPFGARLRLGAPVPTAGDDPDGLARAHRAKGYRAAYCPVAARYSGMPSLRVMGHVVTTANGSTPLRFLRWPRG